MAEVINLATFQLDTQKLQSNLDSLQDTYFDLRKEQKAFSDQSKETAKQIDLLTKSQKALQESAGDNTEAIEENEKQLQALLKTQKDLYKSEQNLGIQMGTVRKEINQTTTQLRAYQDAEGKTASLLTLGNAALERQINNKNDAKAANIALNNVANQLNPNIEEEAQLLVKLNAQMDKNTKFIKENSSETAKQKMNVGNYSSALDGLDAILQKFGVSGQDARTVVTGFTSVVSKASDDISNFATSAYKATVSNLGFKTSSQLAAESQIVQTVATEKQATANVVLATTTETATVATKASTMGLKAFTLALASTGIGLIVIALGSLISYLTNTQSGIDKLNSVLEPLKAIFNGLTTIASSLGSKLVDAFSNPKKALSELYEFVKGNLINRFKAFGVILDGIINLDFKKVTNGVLQAGTGVENLTTKISNGIKSANGFLNDNIKKGQQIAEINRQIGQAQLKYNANQVAVNDALDEQLLISKDTSKSFKERAAAANQIIAITEKNGQAERAILDLELKRLKLQQSIKGEKNLTNAERQEEIDLIAKIDEAEDRGLNARLEQTKVLSGLKKEQAEANKKASEDETARLLQQSKEEIDLFIAKQGFAKKSAEEERKINQQLQEQLEKDAKLRFEKGKISKTAYETELLNISTDFAKKDLDLVIENAELEIDAQMEKNAQILGNDKFLSDEQYRLKQNALKSDYDLEVAHQKLLFDNHLISQKQLDNELLKLKNDNQAKNDALDAQRKADKQNADAIDFQSKKAADEVAFSVNLQAQLAQYDAERAIAREDALKRGADMVAFDKATAAQRKEIERSVFENKLSLASDAFGSLSAIFGAETKAGKAAAIAQTTIDTYKGATSAYSALAGIPFVGPVLGAIAAGAAITAGLANVKKITATKNPEIPRPNYASGVIGLRGSGYGDSDDISANLSAGESVINARSTSMFANELSAINQAGGGVGINGASNILNQNEVQNNANNSQLVSMIAEAVAIGAEAGTAKGSQSGIKELSNDRKVMANAKF